MWAGELRFQRKRSKYLSIVACLVRAMDDRATKSGVRQSDYDRGSPCGGLFEHDCNSLSWKVKESAKAIHTRPVRSSFSAWHRESAHFRTIMYHQLDGGVKRFPICRHFLRKAFHFTLLGLKKRIYSFGADVRLFSLDIVLWLGIPHERSFISLIFISVVISSWQFPRPSGCSALRRLRSNSPDKDKSVAPDARNYGGQTSEVISRLRFRSHLRHGRYHQFRSTDR